MIGKIARSEVKSGINAKAKSLKAYMEKFRPEKAIRLISERI